MDLTPSHLALEGRAPVASPDAYTALYDQLHTTVRRLLAAAVAHARQDAALRMAPAATTPPPPAPAAQPLTDREYQVLQRIAEGDSNKMIARALGLSPHTVKRHVANILDKLDARSRSQAAAWLGSAP
jgi:DNA-binding NarL/FixJ family response regulator